VDREKLRELVLYVAAKSIEDPGFGVTKLNKLLFFCDFLAYQLRGYPLTGALYQRREFGPCPLELLSLQQEMEASGEACVVTQVRYGLRQKRLFPLRDPDLKRFTGEEVALIDQILEDLRYHSATEISTLSHLWSAGWQVAEEGEDVPYETALLCAAGLTDEDVRVGREVARELGLVS
jgi:hypothetical protein